MIQIQLSRMRPRSTHAPTTPFNVSFWSQRTRSTACPPSTLPAINWFQGRGGGWVGAREQALPVLASALRSPNRLGLFLDRWTGILARMGYFGGRALAARVSG